jgi:hypothetical protein
MHSVRYLYKYLHIAYSTISTRGCTAGNWGHVSTQGYWDGTTMHHFNITWEPTSGIISNITSRLINNDFMPNLYWCFFLCILTMCRKIHSASPCRRYLPEVGLFSRFLTLALRCCRCRDRMVVGTTYALSVYHHWCCEFESRLGRGVQPYVIRFVSDLRQVVGVLWFPRIPPPIKLATTI